MISRPARMFAATESVAAGLLAAIACGLLNAVLIVVAGLPPFIATLGVMGIARGVAFIITEGRHFDVSSALPAGWRIAGIPLDWTSPILMIGLAVVACGKAPQPTERSQRLRFAVIPKALDIPVFNYAKIGAEREAASRGNIDIIWRAPESADQLRQKEILESWPVFTKNALAAVPANTKVISFDTIPPAPELLKAGKVQVLLGQKYFGWGGESVRLLADIRAGKMPANPIIDSVSTS